MTHRRCLTTGLSLAVMLVLLAASWPAALADTPQTGVLQLRVGAYENHPKIYRDDSGAFVGLFPDVLGHIAAKEGWHLTYIPGTWTECLERLRQGQIDIMVDVAFSARRAQTFAFSNETFFLNWATVYTPPGQAVESFIDLDGKRVAVMQGSIHTEGAGGIKAIAASFDLDCTFVEVEDYKSVFGLLDSGQADAGVVNRLFGGLFADTYGLRKSSLIFNPRQLKFAFPREAPLTPALVARIDDHLNRLKKDPHSIYNKALEIYLSGLPRELIFIPPRDIDSHPEVMLTAAEKAWIRTHPTLRLGTDPEFAPFEFLGRGGQYTGIAADYVALLNQRLGLNMQPVTGLTWEQAVTGARDGQVDILPCVGYTQARQAYLKFSRPYIDFHRVIIARTETPFMTGLGDLDGLSVAVQANSSHEGYLQENTAIDPRPYPDLKSALMAVSSGEAGAFVGNVASTTHWIRKLNLTNLKVAAAVSQKTQQLHFAVRKDWPELVSIINKGLATITPAEADRIRSRWIQMEYQPGLNPRMVRRYAWQIASVALLVFGVILFWNRSLKKEVRQRQVAEEALQSAQQQLERRVVERTAELAAANESLLCEISDRRQAEQQIRLAEEKWRNTFNSIADFITVLDMQHRIVQANQAFADFLQTSPRQIVGKYCYEVFHGLQAPIAGCPHNQLIAKPRTYTKEIYDPHYDLHLMVTDSPIFENGRLVGSVHIAKDISARKRAEKELEKHRDHLEELVAERTRELSEANQALHKLDQLKSMFIASMSHELRTPLNSIIGFTGIILQGMTGELNATQTDHLGRVYHSAKHLLNLITDVIDISKIEAGRIDVYPETLDLREVVEEALVAIEPQLKAKGLTLETRVPPDVSLFSDRKRLLQAIINYLSNAVKYTENGGITVHAEAAAETVTLTVTDTGIGIPEEDLPRLFEAFERLDSCLRVKAGGTGLGLYLTRKLVTELLQGEISVQSQTGVGSTFGMTIPKTLTTKEDP